MLQTRPPLRFGALEIGFPVVQAALSGYSDWAMRMIARRLGASYAICEVLLDRAILQRGKKSRRDLTVTDEEQPAGAQLMGSDPAEFGPAAARLAEAGFQVIDINFGCPVKKVLGRCRGGYHLGQPEIALEVVSQVRNSVPAKIPVTVKMRRGVDDTPESRDNFYTIIDGAYDRGVAAVTVHPRTVKQRYDGPSNWDFLRELKQHLGDHVLLGSGDLFSAPDCLRMLAQTGVDGVTVARGAIGNPWIFREIGQQGCPPPTHSEVCDTMLEHVDGMLALYGEDRGTRNARKIILAYLKGRGYRRARRAEVARISSAQGFAAFVRAVRKEGRRI